jgi:putative DNA primase/helicase
MTRSIIEFDRDHMLLGVANGVLDLRKQQLLPPSPDLLVLKRCNVHHDPAAHASLWDRFLSEILPDPETREFLQRFAGYLLTGSVEEQKFGFFYGLGMNGKSVVVEIFAYILGEYALKIPTEMLMRHQRSPQGPSPDIVALKGVRFAYANETEEGCRLAESRVKEMTGGDTLTGRVPYATSAISFLPTHKLILVGNHKPEISDGSYGMWRRVALVPFEVTIPQESQDRKLLVKLKQEGPGILNWMLAGLRKWQKDGLNIPKKIEGATAAYRDEQDILGEWLREHCEIDSGVTVKKEDAYQAYKHWTHRNGHAPFAQKKLTRRLGERGYVLQKDRRAIVGIRLNKEGRAAAMTPL